MRKMIPKSFTIFAHKFNVKYSDNLIQREGAVGIYRHSKNEITVQNNIKGSNIMESRQEQTYFHELVHCIFDQIGEDELCNNEKLVDMFSQALHQALTSSKY